jgi:hypothetical protein
MAVPMRAAALVLVLTLLAAGCIGTAVEDTPVEPANTNASVQIGDRPDPTFTADLQAGIVAAPDVEATLAEAPKLRVGEWWKIKMMSPLDGREATYIRVLADIDGDTYVFGMPHEGWYKEAVVYHVPFFGDVGMDLSGYAHDILFTPLKFPLTNEQTWTTKFEGGPDLTAAVTVNEAEKTADVVFLTPNGGEAVKLTYDAKIHEITKFEQATIHYEVVEHGYDFQGWVTVPRAEDLIFFHGRIGPAIDLNLQPAAPVETVEITGGFNRMSFILMRGDLGLAGQLSGGAAPSFAPGVYGIKATDPAGNVYELAPEPMTSGLQVEFFESIAPDGTWTLEYTAAGPGVAFIEGIGYHQYDIKVPTGERRSDHSHPVIR